MKLIYDPVQLSNEFIRLIRQYKAFYWTVAWAGINSKVYKELCDNEAKIDKIVVGIHFYQTHPDFIQKFLSNERIKYIRQPEGVFHPKLYLFYNSDIDWELIVGSANFTKQAFSMNTEASVLLSSKDSDSSKAFKSAKLLIKQCWKESTIFTQPELDDYKVMWAIQKQKLKSLCGKINGRPAIPFHQIQFMVMKWRLYVDKIKKEHNYTLKNRLNMLELARTLFITKGSFSNFTPEERSFIAGIPYQYETPGFENWGCFGSMRGAGTFKKQINQNNQEISKALDEIPMYGEVTEEHFKKYKNIFGSVFTGNSIATFSRLLTMKRPDIFYCITSANKERFCEGFSVIYSQITYDTYWELIVVKIINSEWWLHPNPTSRQELKISETRAAFLDAFCYKV